MPKRRRNRRAGNKSPMTGSSPKKAGAKKRRRRGGAKRRENREWIRSNLGPMGQGMKMAERAGQMQMDMGQQAQQQNIQATRYDQTDAFGNQIRWNPDGSKQTILSPENQRLMDQQRAQQNQIGQAYGGMLGNALSGMQQNPFSYAGLSAIPGQGDMEAFRQKAADSVYDRFSRRMEPQMERQREDFEQMAAERGWSPGSQVYNEQKKLLLQGQQDQRDDAMDRAYTMGAQEAEMQYKQGMQTRQQERSEYDTSYYQPWQQSQMVAGARTGPGPMMGQFDAPQQIAQMGTPDIMGVHLARKAPPAEGMNFQGMGLWPA